MVIDKEQHRVLLLEMFSQISFPGQHLEIACELKRAIVGASVVAEPVSDEAKPGQ
jgi:hypothetical protein